MSFFTYAKLLLLFIHRDVHVYTYTISKLYHHHYTHVYKPIYILVADPGDGRRTRGHPLQHGRGRTQSLPVRSIHVYVCGYIVYI